MQISAQLSCILDSGDGNPEACFNMNPADSWLDIPPKFKANPPATVFPNRPAKPAAAKKTAPIKKATPGEKAESKNKHIILPYHEG